MWYIFMSNEFFMSKSSVKWNVVVAITSLQFGFPAVYNCYNLL